MSNITQVNAPDDSRYKQTYWQYGWEKCKRQPFVPLGALATCVALGGATVALRSGNRKQFNKYLRYRVAAQGITVVAAVAGAFLVTNKAEQVASSRERAVTNQLPPDNEPISYDPNHIAVTGSSSTRLARAKSQPQPQAASDASMLPATSAQTSSSSASPDSPFDADSQSQADFEGRTTPSALAPPPNSADKSTVITALRKRAEQQRQKEKESSRASLRNTGPTRQGGWEGEFGNRGFEARLREAEKNTEDDQVSA